ncbi:MAG: NAD(P)-dependent glycerol-3-phosphate dehydrogenase [Dermatophilaceae bacterium]|nr:NAD(P)-dependent glycerol-3-phosphate dehydrogenase [Dermatophilaceae bacterium]MBP9918796.1 NAD(P)-dependent glycerol-3-phosphate dehydrogenase [Dermatophilaceae bacterium]
MTASSARPQVAVFGTGSWGTAFSSVLAEAGCTVRMWGKFADEVDDINRTRTSARYLPHLLLPESISATTDPEEALEGAAIGVLAVPAQSVRANFADWGHLVPSDIVLVSLMKGLEKGTSLRMSEVVQQSCDIPADQIAVVSGPNIAREIAAKEPAATTVASSSLATAHFVADACHTSYFRPYVHDDVVGAELGGCVKNVIALASGMTEGLGLGHSVTAAVITRGLSEMRALGEAMGAHPATFAGLAGVGDLVVTCLSPHSRNSTFGRNLGRGLTVDEVVALTKQTAEGVASCGAMRDLAAHHGVAMPIVDNVTAVVHEGRTAGEFAEVILAMLTTNSS